MGREAIGGEDQAVQRTGLGIGVPGILDDLKLGAGPRLVKVPAVFGGVTTS